MMTPRLAQAIVIMDEPTGNLDKQNGDTILHLIHNLREQTDTTFAIATHDPSVAAAADRSIQIIDGLIAQQG
jgi:putative ABC transport system ATP-binding protein